MRLIDRNAIEQAAVELQNVHETISGWCTASPDNEDIKTLWEQFQSPYRTILWEAAPPLHNAIEVAQEIGAKYGITITVKETYGLGLKMLRETLHFPNGMSWTPVCHPIHDLRSRAEIEARLLEDLEQSELMEEYDGTDEDFDESEPPAAKPQQHSRWNIFKR